MDCIPATYKMLTNGLTLVNPDVPCAKPRKVERIDQARARGYLVITFDDGTRTSGHESTACFVKL